jgi:hypothetical protein
VRTSVVPEGLQLSSHLTQHSAFPPRCAQKRRGSGTPSGCVLGYHIPAPNGAGLLAVCTTIANQTSVLTQTLKTGSTKTSAFSATCWSALLTCSRKTTPTRRISPLQVTAITALPAKKREGLKGELHAPLAFATRSASTFAPRCERSLGVVRFFAGAGHVELTILSCRRSR